MRYCSGLGLFIFMALHAVSCTNNAAGKEVFQLNVEENSFTIECEGIEYVFPTDIANWAIASAEAMPESMQFFGVDRENSVCIGLFKPEKPHLSPYTTRNFSDKELMKLFRQIVYSDVSTATAFENITYSDTVFQNANAVRFQVLKGVVAKNQSADTVTVMYRGVIFDKGNEPYGIVAITNASADYDNGEDITPTYFSALKFPS